MATSPQTPPPNGERIVRDALAALEVPSTNLVQDFFGGVEAVDISIGEPIPSYTVASDAILAGQLTAAAELTHWRYLLSASNPTVTLATADVAFFDSAWMLTGINRGDLVTATAAALTYARAMPLWNTGDVELRLLQVPALYTVLVWLHSTTEAFLPVVSPEGLLKPGSVLDEPTVLKVLQDIATHYQPVLKS